MTLLDKITEKVLAQIDDIGFTQSGAFNLRHNGIALCHGDSEHIKIKKKQDKPGIDIFIDGKTDGEEVHIPVVVDASGMTDVVYNDFYRCNIVQRTACVRKCLTDNLIYLFNMLA